VVGQVAVIPALAPVPVPVVLAPARVAAGNHFLCVQTAL